MIYVWKWSIKNVVMYMRKKEIEDICKEETQALPGTRNYITGYQRALAQVLDGLDKMEVAKYQDMAIKGTEVQSK